MLIYWLFVILLLNLIISYKITKCIISPPIFFNIGFVVACYFAILYYKEWDMQLLRMNTFLSIALGCSFFSLMSILLIKTGDKNNRSTISVFQPSNIFKRLRLKYFLFLCCILQILVLFLKIHFYKAAFGGYLSFSELLFASRMNFFDEDSVSVFPFWFRNVMQLFTVLNFLFYALFSNLVFFKREKKQIFDSVTYCEYIVTNGMFFVRWRKRWSCFFFILLYFDFYYEIFSMDRKKELAYKSIS